MGFANGGVNGARKGRRELKGGACPLSEEKGGRGEIFKLPGSKMPEPKLVRISVGQES